MVEHESYLDNLATLRRSWFFFSKVRDQYILFICVTTLYFIARESGSKRNTEWNGRSKRTKHGDTGRSREPVSYS